MSSLALSVGISSTTLEEPSAFRLGYRPWADGLRGFAILAVMGYHFPFNLLAHGHVGVDLFFVLSGFLITSLLLEEIQTGGRVSFGKFYARRALRLFPALWLMLIASVVLMYFADGVEVNYRSVWYALLYATNWVVALGLDHVPSPVMLTWSLAIEEQFYILWPVALALLVRFKVRKNAMLTIIGLAIAFVCINRSHLVTTAASIDRIAHASDTRVDGLLFGCFVAIWLAAGLPVPRAVLKAVTALLGIIFLLYMSGTIAPYGIGLTLANLFFGASITLMVSSAGSNWAMRIIEHRSIVWIGKLSYSLYLWHIFAYYLVARLAMPALVAFTASIVLSFTFASISYYLIERPFLRIKRRFSC